MAHEETALRTTFELGAWSVAFAGAAVLLLALVAELLRRRRTASPLVALADRLLPTTSRRVAVALLTLVSTVGAFSMPPSARADDHRTRTWLEEGERTTPTPTAPSPGPTSSSTSSTTSTPLAPPMTTATTAATAPAAPAAPVIAPRAAAVLRRDLQPAPTPPGASPGPTRTPSAPVASPTVASRASTPMPSPPVASPPALEVPTYIVVPGDCLWSIAARRLGPGATGRAVDRGWRAIHAANRDAIGADPNLIHPGLVLALPPLDPTP